MSPSGARAPSHQRGTRVLCTTSENKISKVNQKWGDRAFPASAGGLAHTWTPWSAARRSLHVRHDRGHDGLNLRAHPRRVSARAEAIGRADRHAPCAGLSGYVRVSQRVGRPATDDDIVKRLPPENNPLERNSKIQNASPGRCKKRTNKIACAN